MLRNLFNRAMDRLGYLPEEVTKKAYSRIWGLELEVEALKAQNTNLHQEVTDLKAERLLLETSLAASKKAAANALSAYYDMRQSVEVAIYGGDH